MTSTATSTLGASIYAPRPRSADGLQSEYTRGVPDHEFRTVKSFSLVIYIKPATAILFTSRGPYVGATSTPYTPLILCAGRATRSPKFTKARNSTGDIHLIYLLDLNGISEIYHLLRLGDPCHGHWSASHAILPGQAIDPISV